MTRHFVLGNGTMLVGIDQNGSVRDLFYPYVGQENHVDGQECKVGFWASGQFRWLSDGGWKKKLSYKPETLVTNLQAEHPDLGIKITLNSAVLAKDILLRSCRIENLKNTAQEVRVFFHQNITVAASNIGDTVCYHPYAKGLLHYKGQRYFLMNGQWAGEPYGLTQYATGLVGEFGKEGTWRDAEDGKVEMNPIEHGSVDSTAAFTTTIPANSIKQLHYWMCVGQCYSDVKNLQDTLLKQTPVVLLEETEKYWHEWSNEMPFVFQGLSKEQIALFKRSLLTISTQVDKRGAIIASSDSDMLFLRRDTYSYMWPRDGALISRSLDRAGYSEITERFFSFCANVASDDGYLFHKYRPDQSLGSSWHSWLQHGHIQLPIQEDETALVVYALWKHFEHHREAGYIKKLFKDFIRPAADWMVDFIDERGLPKETYDLWEEKLGVHTFTCATVYAGLNAAAQFEDTFGTGANATKYRAVAKKVKEATLKYLYDKELGRFIKMVYFHGSEMKRDTTHDASSVYGIMEYGLLPVTDARVQSSFAAYEKELRVFTRVGGHARYVDDYYYRVDKEGTPGNPWFIISLWLAEYYIKKAKNVKELQPALDIFEWVTKHALPTGILAEQLHPHTGDPLSVAPLTWSHAGYVIAIVKYLEKLEELGVCTNCAPKPKKFAGLRTAHRKLTKLLRRSR